MNKYADLDYKDPAIERLDFKKQKITAYLAYDVFLYSPDSIDEIHIGEINNSADEKTFMFYANSLKLPYTAFRLIELHDMVIQIEHAKRYNKALL